MSRRKRVLLAIILVELVLAGIWFMLSMAAANGGSSQPDAVKTIGETIGMAMGGLLGLGFILYLMAAKADRAGH